MKNKKDEKLKDKENEKKFEEAKQEALALQATITAVHFVYDLTQNFESIQETTMKMITNARTVDALFLLSTLKDNILKEHYANYNALLNIVVGELEEGMKLYAKDE